MRRALLRNRLDKRAGLRGCVWHAYFLKQKNQESAVTITERFLHKASQWCTDIPAGK